MDFLLVYLSIKGGTISNRYASKQGKTIFNLFEEVMHNGNQIVKTEDRRLAYY
jgi:hypothetical protein